MPGEIPVQPGQIVWLNLDPAVENEQARHRPAVVIASTDYLDIMTNVLVIMPITSVKREWSNHVAVRPADALPRPCWIMTEQPRTLSRKRITSVGPILDASCLKEAQFWLEQFTFPAMG